MPIKNSTNQINTDNNNCSEKQNKITESKEATPTFKLAPFNKWESGSLFCIARIPEYLK
jgi:hypothetical protein